jgi:hypothetical protein
MVTRYAASFRLFGQPHPHGFVDGLSLVELQVGDRLKKILGTLKPTIEFRFAGTFLPRLRDSDSDSFGTIERASPFQSNRYPTPSRCPADSDHSAAGRR